MVIELVYRENPTNMKHLWNIAEFQCDLVQVNEMGDVEQDTVIPMIDGGTEGFKGNARIIYPRMTACIDCTLDLYPPQVFF